MEQSLCFRGVKIPLKLSYFFAVFFVIQGLFVSTAVAQTVPDPNTSCTSKDLELVGATLTGGDLCNTCTPGTTITRTLTLAINNTTGSTRTSFAFWGTLEIYDGNNGNLKSSNPINGCNGPLPPNTITTLVFQNISYTCGDLLKITNLFLAWTSASPNETCPLDPATISPKCGKLPSIEINAGVNGSFVVTNLQCFGANTGAIDLTPTGGTPPYTYSWAASNGGVVPAGQSTNQDLTGLVAGTYTVTITDDNNCVTTKSRDVTGPSAPLTLGTCSKTDVSCTGGDGSVSAGTVSNAVGTIHYSWKNSSNVVVGTTATVNNLPADDYTLTVSDDCSSQACNVTVGAPPPISTPQATVTHQPDCNDGTGTVTVTSPVNGVTYTLTQGGVIKYTADVNGVFSSVVPGTYGLNASNGICSATGDDVTVNEIPQPPIANAGNDFTKTCTSNPSGKQIGEAPEAGFSYSWTPSAGLSADNVSNPTANPTTTTTIL